MRIDLRKDQPGHRMRRTVLLALAIIAALQVRYALDLREQLEELARVPEPHAGEDIVAGTATSEQHAALTRVREELRTPWEPMLNAVLDNAGPDVSLLSIRPDALAGRVDVSGTAVSRRAYLDYAARLRRDPRAGDAQPLGDEPGNEPGASGVAFRLQVSWRVRS